MLREYVSRALGSDRGPACFLEGLHGRVLGFGFGVAGIMSGLGFERMPGLGVLTSQDISLT